jgi:nicotinamide mononucleotide transporter
MIDISTWISTSFLIEHRLEIFAVITGLLYVYLEIKQKKMMWIVGFISSLVFVYVLFSAKIYANMVMYGYYVVISVYGYYKWCGVRGAGYEVASPRVTPRTSHLAPRTLIIFIVISLILSAILGFVLKNFTDSPIPYFDGLVAAFSIVATWMLTQKIIQHWYFWIGINLFCVPLYVSQELYFTAFMYLVYFVMSIIGLKQWKKMQS